MLNSAINWEKVEANSAAIHDALLMSANVVKRRDELKAKFPDPSTIDCKLKDHSKTLAHTIDNRFSIFSIELVATNEFVVGFRKMELRSLLKRFLSTELSMCASRRYATSTCLSRIHKLKKLVITYSDLLAFKHFTRLNCIFSPFRSKVEYV